MVAAKRHMQPTQKTVSSGVLDMHLQGAGSSSQETHVANPKDISTVSSGVLDMHLQGAGGETHAANPKDIYCVEWCIGHASSGSWQ